MTLTYSEPLSKLDLLAPTCHAELVSASMRSQNKFGMTAVGLVTPSYASDSSGCKMIIGIGVDLVDIRRIEALVNKFGQRFLEKIFTDNERSYAESTSRAFRAYANRFAAKEATVKALGTGFRDGIGWHDIELSRSPSGAPALYLHNHAYKRFESLLPPGYIGITHVSFSDEPPYSTAFVILSATSPYNTIP